MSAFGVKADFIQLSIDLGANRGDLTAHTRARFYTDF